MLGALADKASRGNIAMSKREPPPSERQGSILIDDKGNHHSFEDLTHAGNPEPTQQKKGAKAWL